MLFSSCVLCNFDKNGWLPIAKLKHHQRRNVSRYNPLDKSFFALPTSFMDHDQNKMMYFTFLLTGKLSLQYCQTVFSRYFTNTRETFYNYVNKNVTALYTPINGEIYLKFTISGNGKISLENGYTNEDGCGILIRNKDNYHLHSLTSEQLWNTSGVCGLDSCLLHLQSLRFSLNISSLDD